MIIECVNPQFCAEKWYGNENSHWTCKTFKYSIKIVIFLSCAGLIILLVTMAVGIGFHFGTVTEHGPDYDMTFQTFVPLHIVCLDIFVIIALLCQIITKDGMLATLLCLMSVMGGILICALLFIFG